MNASKIKGHDSLRVKPYPSFIIITIINNNSNRNNNNTTTAPTNIFTFQRYQITTSHLCKRSSKI